MTANTPPSRFIHAEPKSAAARGGGSSQSASQSRSAQSSTDPDSSTISASQASVFLKLGIAGPRRPVDDLIERLKDPNAAQWLNTALLSGPLAALGSASKLSPIDLLTRGQATLEQCSAIKEASKKLVKHAASPNERLAGIAGYFISLATGLRFHDVLLTTHGREELSGILLDLAEAAPEPYSTLLSEAALAHAGE